MRDNQKFINTSVEYFEELEATYILKNKGDKIRNKILKLLTTLHETITIENKKISDGELVEKLEEIEGLICDMAINTKRDYFKLGFQMKEFIKVNSDLKEND